MQLNLFEDSPRFYFRALECLGRLDFEGCRRELAEHRRFFRSQPDPGPVARACQWLEGSLAALGPDAPTLGRGSLGLVRDIREGRAVSDLAGLGAGLLQAVAASVSGRCLAAMEAQGLDPEMPLAEGLPWGAFHLFSGRFPEAQGALEAYLVRGEPTPEAYLALGDARWGRGRCEAAYLAYREGYARDPQGGGWAIECKPLRERREALEGRREWADGWWAVGAYLEGVLPRFGVAAPQEVQRRLDRFRRLRRAWLEGEAVEPQLFFAGIFLSENARRLPAADTTAMEEVRGALAELHPEAWERHWERLGSEESD